MTKFKVVRYWDTYPDGVIAICDTEEEAEKITARYSRKLMNCLARLAGKNPFDIRDILGSSNKLKKYDHETRNAKINLKDSNSSRNSDKTESYR